MNWVAYGMRYGPNAVCIYNDGPEVDGRVQLAVSFDLTIDESKALRKEMKAAEKVARGEAS